MLGAFYPLRALQYNGWWKQGLLDYGVLYLITPNCKRRAMLGINGQSFGVCVPYYSLHSAKDTRIWGVAKPDSDTLARLYGLVRGYPEVIGTQLPVIRAQ